MTKSNLKYGCDNGWVKARVTPTVGVWFGLVVVFKLSIRTRLILGVEAYFEAFSESVKLLFWVIVGRCYS